MTPEAPRAGDDAAVDARPLDAAEVERLRAETPGCAHVTHFNHAGSSLPPGVVVETVVGHLRREAEIGGYEAADEAAERLGAVYGSLARLLNAESEDIAIVENATRAWDLVFYAIPFAPGDRILTSVSEYGSNVIAFLQVAGRGIKVEVVPNDASGQLDVEELARRMDDRVKLVAVSHMPTNGGLLQPAAAIGEVVRGSGAIYLLDACQTAGQVPLHVEEIGCDFLTASARKYLRGPRGIGFLYAGQPWRTRLTPPFLDMRAAELVATDRYQVRDDARRFENWESSIANVLGMGAAVDYALEIGLDRIWVTVRRRAETLRAVLTALPGDRVAVHDLGAERGGIVSFTVEGWDAEAIKGELRSRAINVSVTGISSTRSDMEARGLDQMVRASVHYLTTDEDIERLGGAIGALAPGNAPPPGGRV